MTGTASSRGRSVLEFDIHRNQEWLRRRKLRLEQVRKQSNEIARVLRQKVINHEKARLEEYDRLSEAKFLDWKAEKLEELERKLMYALEDFGEGYKLAEAEPDPEEVLEEQYKIDWAKAQKRGEIAHQEELKRRKSVEEHKMAAIERKKLVRKKEDLRSALVLSVPLKKQLLESQKVPEQVYPEKPTSVKKKMNSKDPVASDMKKKMSVNKGKKKVTSQKSCLCKRKSKTSDTSPLKGGETIWINLNDIQNSSAGDLGVKHKSSKSSRSNDKSEKPEGTVEFYDFSSRYYCKSFKEFPHLVERIDHETEVLNANDLATMENEVERLEVKKKIVADVTSQERGMEALKREKINQDYNNLITKLEELNRKEKIMKAQQRKPLSFLHMNDERLSERLKMKQRLMDAKFEEIYYEALSQISRKDAPQPKMFNSKGGGDFDDGKSTRLSFTTSCLKPNSPVTSDEDSKVRKPTKTKKKRQLLIDIDKALREGRELRKSVSRNRETGAEEEQEQEKEGDKGSSGEEDEEEEDIVAISPRKDEEKKTKSQESQTEELKTEEVGGFGKTGDDSLPVSTSTSYKSPPSVIRSYRLRQFLEYLEGVSEAEGGKRPGDAVVSKMDALLQDLYHNRRKEKEDKSSPTLEYYIEKLLNMSRECVADLSVSSENVSTPNITDVEESKATTPVYFCTVSTKGEDLVRKSRLNTAEQLEETIRNWKRILEKDSGEMSEVEDVVESSYPQPGGNKMDPTEEPSPAFCSPKINFKRYEEITKKCSERISELSNMLEKVRKDKEKLLTSTSGSSASSSNKDEVEESEADVEEEKEEAPSRGSSPETTKNFMVEGFLNRYDFTTGKESVSTTAVVDSQSCQDHEESLESWPDIMSELLRRKIITSPFKWSEGDFSSELTDNQTKPSSIETVIGNFRKEINKIKAFSLSDSFPNSSARSNSSDEKQVFLCSPKKRVAPSLADGEEFFQEESSVESINHALTTLGLNWARSFLRKNEQSKAMSSSSEGKSSDNEPDDS